MDVKQGRARQLCDTGRRIAVLVVVISCHMGLLVLILGSVPLEPTPAPGGVDNSAAITLRFFRQQRTLSMHIPAPTPRRSNPGLQHRDTLPQKLPSPFSAQRVAPVAAPLSETNRTSTPSTAGQYSLNDPDSGYGGFQERLRKAKPSYGVPRLPGSDAPVITGIQLAAPMSQGIGVVMRNAQRLFGITSSHCIDVNTWRSLTPQELNARHISPDEVDQTDERYACNAPPGLHF